MNTTTLDPRQPRELSALCTFGCMALAVVASGISILMAAFMGFTMGGRASEKAVWAVCGIVPVLGAHWLPSLSRGAGAGVRAMTWVMWAICLVYATYSHASFFLLAQQEAGMHRAERPMYMGEPSAPTRPLSAILTETVKVRGELTRTASVACPDCRWVRNRIAELSAKVEALEAEAREARRSLAFRDQADRLRNERRVDPVTSKLAAWLGIAQGSVALAPALLVAVILDGLASLCWLLATQRRDRLRGEQSQVAATRVTPVTPASQVRDLSDLVTEAKAAHLAGMIRKLTVAEVRTFLGCSQERASAVCKALRAVE